MLAEQQDEVEKEPLLATLSSIGVDGKFLIMFTEEVRILPNLTMINNGTTEVDGVEVPVLQLDIIPGKFSHENVKKLGFTWNATEQTSHSLLISVYFDEPLYISLESDPEKL